MEFCGIKKKTNSATVGHNVLPLKDGLILKNNRVKGLLNECGKAEVEGLQLSLKEIPHF